MSDALSDIKLLQEKVSALRIEIAQIEKKKSDLLKDLKQLHNITPESLKQFKKERAELDQAQLELARYKKEIADIGSAAVTINSAPAPVTNVTSTIELQSVLFNQKFEAGVFSGRKQFNVDDGTVLTMVAHLNNGVFTHVELTTRSGQHYVIPFTSVTVCEFVTESSKGRLFKARVC